jgi:hypothetical protein
VSGQQAVFNVVFDTSLSCGGDVGVTAVVNDGFLQSDPTDPEAHGVADSTTKDPSVAMYAPRAGNPVFLPNQHVEVQGGGYDAQQLVLSDTELQWFVDGSTAVAAVGPQADLGPLPVGTHQIILVGTDPQTLTPASVTRTVTVLADSNGDGIPDKSASCGADGHPYTDSLGDGVTNLDRFALTGDACVPVTSFGATITWRPDPLNVSILTSLLGDVFVTVKVPGKNVSQIDPKTVKVRLGSTETGPTGTSPDGPTPCPTLTLSPTPGLFGLIPAWRVSNGVATAHINRDAVNDWFVRQCPIRNDSIPVVVTGSAFAGTQPAVWSFNGMTTFTVKQS